MRAESDWLIGLASERVDDKLATLQTLSHQEAVSGITVACIELVDDAEEEVRMWASEALQRAVQPDRGEVDALAELLRQPNAGEIAYWAATMLGRLQSDAVEGVGALQDCLLHSSYLPARERAAWALAQIGPPAASAIGSLEAVSAEAPPRLKRLACEAIQAIGHAP
ncbi:MAG: HEAT repeat domain-containing protein [Novipirellula sp. JB048]